MDTAQVAEFPELQIRSYRFYIVPEGHYLRERFDDMDLYYTTVERFQKTDTWWVTYHNRIVNNRSGLTHATFDVVNKSRADLETAYKKARKFSRKMLRDLEARYPQYPNAK